ncbi:MAG: DUF2935 domain-containing protein [Clostridia bacterium]|nr:DUF2935 domain-containing protein [Clostridia bacterium]
MNGWDNGCTAGLPMMLPIYPLGEIRFWLEIQREHTVFLRNALPGLEPIYRQELESFERTFADQGRRPVTSVVELRRLADDVNVSSGNFLRLLETIRDRSGAAQAASTQALLGHMMAETRYFLRILGVIRSKLSYSSF